MDLQAIRDQFPALSRRHLGKPVAYLDGPAGTQVPTAVINAITTPLRAGISNLGGPYPASALSEQLVDDARSAMADLYNAEPAEIVFGQNMTSHTFALSRALAQTWSSGDDIVLTRLDHDANITPWMRAAEERGVTVRFVDFSESMLDPAAIGAAIGARTRLVAVTAASNAIGTVVDIPAVAAQVRRSNSLLFVDAVHCAPHRLIDVKAWDVDFLVSSAYKFYGPHIGVLYIRSDHLRTLPAYRVRPAPDVGPGRWETGTQSFETIAGVTAAVDHIASLGHGQSRRDRLASAYEVIGRHEHALTERFLAGLAELDHVRLYGLQHGNRTSTFSVSVAAWEPRQVAEELGEQGIYVSDGTYYAVEVMKSLGVAALVRIGFVHYNTLGEVDAVLNGLDDLG
ncbi:MAG: cysteine desulfurase-like protein [Acidimicrobiia bacterium]|nr:cysteine desulfurase-like protein [Acidimicrobiia bacterium]